jgi:hypothetical protein
MTAAATLPLATLAEARAAIEYFNAFHDGFLRRVTVTSHDRFADRDTQECSGRLDLTLRFAHWNWDFAAGARPHTQEVELELHQVRDLRLAFGGRETDWCVLRVEVTETTRPGANPAAPDEPCLQLVLVQPRLRDGTAWVEHEDLVLTFSGGEARAIPA